MDKLHFDRTDYSVVVKNMRFNRAGKEALKQLLDKLPVSQADIRADHARLPRERFM
jgi:hypothetical protein